MYRLAKKQKTGARLVGNLELQVSRTMKKDLLLCLLCPLLIFTLFKDAHPLQAQCQPTQPTLHIDAPNIFNEQQEQDLGDALAEMLEADMRLAAPSDNDELTRIGNKLLATLPPTRIHYTFRIYDSGEINAFSVAGGRVYVSRKLIAATQNEDELAGVLAHEIGHLATHQTAITMTRIFALRLGVNAVRDREEIFTRVHQAFSSEAKKHETVGREVKEELLADRVSIYALVQAGYQAESFANFFNKISLNKNKTGNWFSDAFGVTNDAAQRYRSAVKLVAELPSGCSGRSTHASPEFAIWQKAEVEERLKTQALDVANDKIVTLDPPLKPSPWHLRFSPDGRYIMAQDEGGIDVADRASLKMLFRIDAPNADMARFSPNSKELAFTDGKLRAERWDLATQKRISVHELIVPEGCHQHELATDARTLFCVSLKNEGVNFTVGLKLIDIESGNALFEKPKFATVASMDYYRYISILSDLLSGSNLINTAFSPDGRFVVGLFNGTHFAYDLSLHQPVKLEGKFKETYQPLIAFVANDRLAIRGSFDDKGYTDLTIYSFPEGRKLDAIKIGDQQFAATTQDGTISMSPLKDYNKGIYDLQNHKMLVATKMADVDIWNNLDVSEDALGQLRVEEASTGKAEKIARQMAPLPFLQTSAISPDGKYIAFSLRNRLGIWDAESGKQLSILRPYSSAWYTDQGTLLGICPKYATWEKAEMAVMPDGKKPGSFLKYDLGSFEKEDLWQSHTVELHLKALGKNKEMGHNVELEARSLVGHKELWKMSFLHERPAIWNTEDERILLGWDLDSDAAKEQIKASSNLQNEANALSNRKKGLLLSTLDGESGRIYQSVVIPEADLTHGWNDERWARVSGMFVLVHGEHDNTAIYQLEDGKKVGEFFGSVLSTNASTGLAVAINRDEELMLIDERTGKELRHMHLGSPVRTARILLTSQPQLLVLTADQKLHHIDLKDLTH